MKKAPFLILILYISISPLIGQETTSDEYPAIEIYGMAEEEIDPDEIYIEVILKEKYDGRKKISIIEQEEQLIAGMKSINIIDDNISLSDSESGFVKVNWLKKDVITTKSFTIKARDANQVKQIFTKLDELDIQNAFIVKVDHSKIREFEKQVRIEAIKDAKEKANYLLEAIGEKLGNPMKIYEDINQSGGLTVRGSRAGGTNYYIDGIRVNGAANKLSYSEENEIKYEKIILRSVIYIKFKIE